MKTKLLRTFRERFHTKYLKDKVILIDYTEKRVEEFVSIDEATSFIVYEFCGMEIHRQYVKRSRFRNNLNKYYREHENKAIRTRSN